MTQGFQRFTKRYANVLAVLIGLALVSSILIYSGCGMTSSPNIPTNPTPTPTPPPDTTPPTSTITSPTEGAIAPIGKPGAITGTASDAGGGSVVRVEVSVDGGATYSAATGANAWSFNWTPSAVGQVTIKSRAVDNTGNVQNPPAEIHVTGDVPPTVTSFSPPSGRQGVSVDSNVIVIFSEDMDPTTVNTDTVKLRIGINGTVDIPATVTYGELQYSAASRLLDYRCVGECNL
jgi:hypothetical protein